MAKKLLQVTLVTEEGAEWEALYFNGKLVAQDHNINVDRLMDLLTFGGYVKSDSDGYLIYPSFRWLHRGTTPEEQKFCEASGYLPENIK